MRRIFIGAAIALVSLASATHAQQPPTQPPGDPIGDSFFPPCRAD